MALKRRIVRESSSSQKRRQGNNPPPSNPHEIIFGSEDQKAKYEVLDQRKIVSTRYVDESALRQLGLLDDVLWMFKRLGWVSLMSSKSPTYKKVTLEFLSSLNENASADGQISFQLFNHDHAMSLAEFNALLELPVGGERKAIVSEFNQHGFWNQLTGINMFRARTAKATSIQNPIFRYLHRVMAHTIFGRGESDGAVRRDELFFLWAMVNGVHVDTGVHLIRHMHKVGNADKGQIVIGGLVTTIAARLGYDFQGLPQVSGHSRLDMETCIAIKMIVKQGDNYHLLLKDGTVSVALPDPDRTSIRDEANWRCAHLRMGDDEEEQLMPFDDIPEQGDERAITLYDDSGTSHAGDSSGADDIAAIRASITSIEAEQRAQRTYLESIVDEQRAQRQLLEAIHGWLIQKDHFPHPPQ